MRLPLGSILLGILVIGVSIAQEPPAADSAPLTLVLSTGKEVKLTGVKFTQGVRRLAWLADPKGQTEDDRRGPLALELRESHSTTYQKGVVTLLPLSTIAAIRYDYDRKEMTVEVKGLAGPLKGTLQYRGINVLGLQGQENETAGKFTGGIFKDGFRSLTFPEPRPLPSRPAGGLTWAVQIDQLDARHPILTVRNLRALYSYPGGLESLAQTLPIRKNGMETVSFDSKLERLEMVAVDPNTRMAAVEMTTSDGAAKEKLVAIPLTREEAGRTGVLVGLLGEVDAGWKLFPLHAIKVIQQAGPRP